MKKILTLIFLIGLIASSCGSIQPTEVCAVYKSNTGSAHGYKLQQKYGKHARKF